MNVKKHLGWIIAGAVVVILLLWCVTGYNGLVSMDEQVAGKWANVETQYQRRADLIPNLVNTVKGYATHEQETLEGVIEARSKATQIKVDASELTPERLAQFQRAQGELTAALGKLLAIREQYPDLKANQNFLELQSQLEGTENRITVARKDFNDAAKAYNVAIRRFPKTYSPACSDSTKVVLRGRERGREGTRGEILTIGDETTHAVSHIGIRHRRGCLGTGTRQGLHRRDSAQRARA